MKQHVTILAFLFVTLASFGQQYNVSGVVKDSTNGEDMFGVKVRVQEISNFGASSDPYGFYSLSLPPGNYTLEFRASGYNTKTIKVNVVDQSIRINLELGVESAVKEIAEVKVTAKKKETVMDGTPGETELDLQQARELPNFGGVPDVVEHAKRQPSFKSAGEGNSGYYVRGGGLDQNLVMLDETVLYNPSHLLGFFSVFNADALKTATTYSGGIPAQYGGRTSSVLDITMKDGNSKKFGVSGSLGLIAASAMVEGPIQKDKGSFMISGRRTYADLFLRLSPDDGINQSALYFYDLNMKASYKLTENDKIYLSGYFGRDNFGFGEDFGLQWGNAMGSVRWNHIFDNNLFMKTTVSYGTYDYEFGFGADEDRISLQSVIRDWNFKQHYKLRLNESNVLKFGYESVFHTIEPGNLTAGSNTGIETTDAEPDYALESALFIQNETKFGNRLSLNYGLRYSLFHQLGSGTAYEFDDIGNVTQETSYDNGDLIQFYHGLEPRFSANYLVKDSGNVALKLGYNRNFQYMHLLTNATTSTPTDVWIMSSNNTLPQIADQISFGYFQNSKNGMYKFSSEVYYKYMQNTIDYRNGANVFLNDAVEGDLVYGTGESYGIEFSLKKEIGKLQGFIGYTLSKTTRQFDEINDGEKFSARQDRTHDVSIGAVYRFHPKWTVSTNFVYYTGDAVTFPTSKYAIDGYIVPFYSERNGYRMPDYHRLDLGLTWYNKKTEKFESNWNLSVYNAYGRENAYSIAFQPSEADPNVTEAVQLSLFRWIPTITYNFKF